MPQFYVFYNGSEEMADREEYDLSDQYKLPVDEPALELKVIVLNINAGRNRELMEKCKELREYSEFVHRTNEALKGKKNSTGKQEAMGQVIDGCIRDGILQDFLSENRRRVLMSSILEYDEQAHMEAVHDDGYDEGYDQGYGKGYDQGSAEQKKYIEAERARADAAERELEKMKQKLQEANIPID